MRLALLLLLALPAHAQHVATGIAADLYAPPAPVEDPGGVLVAQAAPQPGTLTLSHPPPAFEHSTDPLVPKTPTPDELAARLAVLEAAVNGAKKELGVPAPKIPASFWDKPQGIALSIVFSVATMAISAAGSYATIAAAGR